MREVNNYNFNNNGYYSPVAKGVDNTSGSYVLEAHHSNNMKVAPPRVSVNDITQILNENKRYSIKEANNRSEQINKDIYAGVEKEKENHEFNFKRYFTIFGIVALLTAFITYFSKGRG